MMAAVRRFRRSRPRFMRRRKKTVKFLKRRRVFRRRPYRRPRRRFVRRRPNREGNFIVVSRQRELPPIPLTANGWDDFVSCDIERLHLVLGDDLSVFEYYVKNYEQFRIVKCGHTLQNPVIKTGAQPFLRHAYDPDNNARYMTFENIALLSHCKEVMMRPGKKYYLPLRPLYQQKIAGYDEKTPAELQWTAFSSLNKQPWFDTSCFPLKSMVDPPYPKQSVNGHMYSIKGTKDSKIRIWSNFTIQFRNLNRGAKYRPPPKLTSGSVKFEDLDLGESGSSMDEYV